jgi:hypothetical protein
VLFSYTIEGKEYSIMKRGTLRSLYAQIVLFSFKGIYTMFRDTTMKLMIFATGNVYKKEVFPEMQFPMIIKNRTKWAQRGVLVFGLLAMTSYILGGVLVSPILRVSSTVMSGLAIISLGVLSYKNISLVMVKRLLRESDVIVILLLSLINLSINIGKPKDSVSPFTGIAYVLVVNGFTFSDSMISKSRVFIILLGSLYVTVSLYDLYQTIIGVDEYSVVLFKYEIGDRQYTIMKRTAKRWIYTQVLLFGAKGVYIMFKDNAMERMMFATGNIFRSTGTTSSEVKDEKFSSSMNLEKIEMAGGRL